MESEKTNEGELTSTMGGFTSTTEEEKNDNSDSTPTSSTDAFTTTSKSQIAADDPISSTSSDVSTDKVNEVAQSSTNVMSSNSNKSLLKDITMGDTHSPIVSEKDLLDMNITDTSTEKITENVDDLVQDLENLLGEPTTSFSFTIRSRENKTNGGQDSAKNSVAMDLDECSAELEMLGEPSTDFKLTSKAPPPSITKTEVVETPEAPKNTDLYTETCAINDTVSQSTSKSQEDLQSNDTNTPEEHDQSCQSEVISASTEIQQTELTSSEDITNSQSVDKKQDIENTEETKANSSCEKMSEVTEVGKESENTTATEVSSVVEVVKSSAETVDEVLPTPEVPNPTAVDDISKVEPIQSTSTQNESVISVKEVEEVLPETVEDQKESVKVSEEVNKETSDIEQTNASEKCDVSPNLPDNTEKDVNDVITEDERIVEEPTKEEVQDTAAVEMSDLAKQEDEAVEMSEVCQEEKMVVDTAEDATETVQEQQLEERSEEAKTVADESQSQENTETEPKPTEVMETLQTVEEVKESILAEPAPQEDKKEEEEHATTDFTTQNMEGEEIAKQTQQIEEPVVTETLSQQTESLSEEVDDSHKIEKEEVKEDIQTEPIRESTENQKIEEMNDKQPLDEAVEMAKLGMVPIEQIDQKMTPVTEVEEQPEQVPVKSIAADDSETQKTIDAIIEQVPVAATIEAPEAAVAATEQVSLTATVTTVEGHMAAGEQASEATTTVMEQVPVLNTEEASEVVTAALEQGSAAAATVTVPEVDVADTVTATEETSEAVTTAMEQASVAVTEEEAPEPVTIAMEEGSVAVAEEKAPEPVTIAMEEGSEASITVPVTATIEAPEAVTFPMEQVALAATAATEETPNVVSVAVEQVSVDATATVMEDVPAIEQDSVPSAVATDPVVAEKVPAAAAVVLEINRTVESPNVNHASVEKLADIEGIKIQAVDFIPDNLEIQTPSLTEDLDLLVQNTINESITSEQNTIELQEAISSVDTLKTLPLEEVPDIEVLNAISSLNEQEPDLAQNLPETDALLTSSTIEEESSKSGLPFEPSVETTLPTVDEIFAEPSQPTPELQDDNLETLLAVASLQSVGDYSMPSEDYTTSVDFNRQESVPEETPKVEQEDKLKEPLVINIEETERERIYSPKIIIKPIKPPEEEQEEIVSVSSGDSESNKGSLKMTITKQSDNMHSILKIYNPEDESVQVEQNQVPKLIIKPIIQPNEQPHSPKISTRSSKQTYSPSTNDKQRSSSPRIHIKPIPKPEESVAPLKITIKPIKSDESHKQKHSPKLTIKPIHKPDEESSPEPKVHSPRVTIKPIVKPPDEIEQVSSPRITIKPIVKPPECSSDSVTITTTPKLTIKPIVKPPDKDKCLEIIEGERSSPKITIKPIIKPQEVDVTVAEDFEESIKERIVLKINKGTIPTSKESKKEDDKLEKLAKIKVKISKGGGHPQIVQELSPNKRSHEQTEHEKSKKQKVETEHLLPGITITPIAPPTHSKLKEMLCRNDYSSEKVVTIEDDDDVTIVETSKASMASPIVISEESNQDSQNATAVDLRDPISEIPVFEITPDSVKTINPHAPAPVVEVPVAPPAPRKRGRPRKVPLQVREDFKDPKEEELKPVVVESTRPKRSCRGQSVRTTLGIKPRKPRGPGRGRGSKRGMGTRSTPTPSETSESPRPSKELKLSASKLNEIKEDTFLLSDKTEVKQIEIDDGFQKSPSNSLLAPPQSDTTTDRADIVMYEEETRMSADTSSRAQTPAKQIVTTVPTVDLVEESQSSVQSIQSTATTESVRVRRGPRLEVHQEPEGAVISAEQLAEYYWQGGGPYMLQEQVAQFLGIKSFKRKYPNIQRRVVDMQERDFIRESGLAGEAMCDLGLTAVNSSDILDIMYSDFQDKYEEYCKHQRDRQAKDLTNKQRALSLAASQEKTKIDITQQAVQSAANWNATFNKTRREQRKACMDLQTLTVHYPKGKMKQINKPKIGHYPVALVPGQFTDYYREFTPTELNNLPLNTVLYDRILRSHEMECDSQTDGSGSESDTSSSDSDSSYSGSSDGEDCTLCKPAPKRLAAAQ